MGSGGAGAGTGASAVSKGMLAAQRMMFKSKELMDTLRPSEFGEFKGARGIDQIRKLVIAIAYIAASAL